MIVELFVMALAAPLERLQHLFWGTLYGILKFLKDKFIDLLPDSAVRNEMFGFLVEDCNIKIITTFDGEDDPKKQQAKYDSNHKYACELVVKNPAFFRAILKDDFMALGESYMDGWWECDRVDDLLGAVADGHVHVYSIVKFLMKMEDKMKGSINNQTREKAHIVVEEHYNLGNDLYQLMLDPSMNYTCGYWKEDTKDLTEAQQNKMDLIARKLNLKPGMTVLDIGCGFGAMAKYLAQNYDVSVTCYNISTEQVKFAKENCKGLDVTFIMEDYRNANGKFDRIYSIGFFEAVGVKNFREYFEVVHRCLKDDGLTLLHTITFNQAHPYPSRNPRWFDRYIFPGGELPFVSDCVTYPSDLFVLEDVQSLGRSYTKTLLSWHENFNKHWEKSLKEKYDKQQGGKFYRMWVFYLLSCAGLFNCQATQLHQFVYSKTGRKEDYKGVR